MDFLIERMWYIHSILSDLEIDIRFCLRISFMGLCLKIKIIELMCNVKKYLPQSPLNFQ